MSSTVQPIKVWGKRGANPPKVIALCEELGIPYEAVDLNFTDLKQNDFLSINPNGRMPAIQDPNTGITLFESGAISEYLVDKYDPEHRISFTPGTELFYHAKQWNYFQMSGQGPYYGQAVWFFRFHHEKLPSAVERYWKEIRRVTSVLEEHLKKQEQGSDGPWMVGGKFSYVDINFFSWQNFVMHTFGEDFNLKEFPVVGAWVERMKGRPAFVRAMDGQM